MRMPSSNVRILMMLASIVVLLITIGAAVTISSKSERVANPWHDAELQSKFVHDYESWHGDVSIAQGFELWDNAIQMCVFLDKNPDLSEAWKAGVESGMSSDQAGTVIMLGVKYWCTDHNNLYPPER